MTTPLRRRLRLARRGAWYAVAIALVMMAVMAGIVSQLLPLAERHPDRIAAWLSERAGRPIHFDKVETQWTRRGPLLRLDGMRVGQGAQTVVIGDAEMLVSQYAGLFPGRSFTELRLRGLDLTLERGRDGRWSVHGLPGQEQQPSGDPFDTLEGLGELQVIGAKLTVIAPDLGIAAHLPRVDLRLRVDGERLRAGARAWAQAGRSPLEAVIDFDRGSGNGRAWFAAKNADLSAWSPLLRGAGITVIAGGGRAQAWADLRAHRVATVTVDANLSTLRLRGAPVPQEHGAPQASSSTFAQLQVRARWKAVAGGWRLDAPRLRIVNGQRTQTLDGLVVAGGLRYGLLADQVDAGPLFSAMALSDRVTPGLRRWLLATHPQAMLRNIVVTGARGGAMHASGRVDGLAFAAIGNAPGVSGLSGTLDGDDRGVRFDFDASRPMRFDWPAGFGVAHVFALRGQAAAWRDDDGWHVATPALRLDGSDVDATVHGGLLFKPGAGARIDIAAELGDVPVTAARGFWVRYLMAPAALQWLDNAFLGGTVHDGHAIVSGDLSDWPFAGDAAHDLDSAGVPHQGMFKATGHITGALLKFDPQWPPLDHVDADVAFAGNGFTVGGKGVLGGVGIRRFNAGIDNFGKADLRVDAEGGGDASRLLGLLVHSPLHATYGDTIDNISASGLAAVTFDLDLPLHEGGGPSAMSGTVALAGARLAEKHWDLVFDGVRGRARYGNGGFEADKLAVVHQGQPGKLSLRAGDFTRDAREAFEADLDAAIGADDLVQRAPALDWLKPYLDGRSNWTVGVTIPKTTGAASTTQPTHLTLRSDLVGTTLALPAPLRKNAAAALPATIETALPLGTGETSVALGNLLGVRARSNGKATGVRIVVGSNAVAEVPPASGLVVEGHASALDALDWIAIVKGSNGGSGGNSLPLRGIDVAVDRLLLLGAMFPSARLQVSPATASTLVQVQGDALSGTVRIPDADGATVSGQFQHVHWRGVPAVAGSAPAAPSPTQDVDPARIPALALDVADFRFGDARLGGAILRTHPLANGMRIEQLQTRAADQRVDVTGEWTGRGASARTHLATAIDSNDFGALLTGLGYGGQLSRGHGSAHFDAAWPGAPSAFSLGALSGTLKLAVREGQLTEVEPGAGRVLGLLSLAQLPRRLTLDFHDFFSKGFAFDTLDGDVRIDGGQARSDNLHIDGPAAEIRIRGTTNLVAQQFDQTIEVFPKAGNLLTVAGALAAGPVGAAIGAAANAVLKKPLGRLAAKTYRVTGPWKEPKVEVISREQSRQDAAATSPPAG
ncbi:MAG TPA: YhdP family protein [Luteimonas sp.]|nr:YhdP family protein [Luteimonas sp.]